MPAPAYTADELRGAVLTALRRQIISDYHQLRAEVSEVLGHHPQSDAVGGEPLFQVVWDLVGEGVLFPFQATESAFGGTGWPKLTLTKFGREVLDATGPIPNDRDGYVAALIAEAAPSAVALVYVDEALIAFRGGAYIATIDMLGAVAAEQLEPLVDAAATWVGGNSEQKLRSTRLYRAADRLDALRGALRPRQGDLPSNIAHELDTNLTGIADFLRRARNEASHPSPSNRALRRQHAWVMFQLLRDYLGFIRRLTDWLRTASSGRAP